MKYNNVVGIKKNFICKYPKAIFNLRQNQKMYKNYYNGYDTNHKIEPNPLFQEKLNHELKQKEEKERTRNYYNIFYGNQQHQNNNLFQALVRQNHIHLNQNGIHYKKIKAKPINRNKRHEYKTTKTANGKIFKQYAK